MLRSIRRYWYHLLHPAVGMVWQLHRVTNEVSQDTNERAYEITPNRLVSLIEEYLSKGYHFISVDQLYTMYKSNQWDRNFICITLDDGYADNYEIAYSIFKHYNIPFCIFITQNYMINGKKPYCFLAENQIIKLSYEPLCTIGSHTVSHPHLNQLSTDKQKTEIEQSKTWLERLIGQSINTFAYPYGAYAHETIDIVKSSGMRMAFAAWGGAVRKNTPECILTIPRVLVTETTIQ